MIMNADIPERPVLSDPLLISECDTYAYYLLQWSQPSSDMEDLDHYELSKDGGKELFVNTLDNKTIISVSIGVTTIVAVSAVNKCGQKSQTAEKHLNTTRSKRQNYIVFVLAALAIIFCIVCVVLMVVILIFVFWRLRHTNVRKPHEIALYSYVRNAAMFVHA